MSRKKILIVDDDLDMRRAMHVRLKASGDFETIFATDGMTATSAAMKEKPDLIILDLGLPAGDGFVVLDRLHRNPLLACIPVIVVSGRDPAEVKSKVLAAGGFAFLEKPPDPDELLATIQRALDGV